MNKLREVLWGIFFALVGVVLLLNVFEVTNINLFIKGWWCIVIIIYALIELITSKEKLLNFYFLLIGILLFVIANDYISFAMIAKVILPLALISLGIYLVYHAIKKA